MFTDLVKAFELVNTKWGQAILVARGVPRWLRKSIDAFIGKRNNVAKIMGRLVKAIHVKS